MVTLGEHCSMAERRADDATRDVVDFLKCEYMEQHVGEVFDGTIATVTGFGLFVSLDEVFVEGLIHISNLANDFYQFDQVKHRLVGERTRRTFRLGDKVSIQVMSVSLDDRKIDFALAAAPGEVAPVTTAEYRQNKKSADKKEHKRPVSRRPISFEKADDNTAGSNTEGGDKTGEPKKRRGPRRNGRKKSTNAGSANKPTTSNAADQKAKTTGGSNSTSSKTDKPAKKKKRSMSKRQKMNGAEAKSKSQSADASSKSKNRKPKKPGSAKKKAKKSNAKAHIA
jgi:ribonuclease R